MVKQSKQAPRADLTASPEPDDIAVSGGDGSRNRPLPDVTIHSSVFRQTRAAHRTELLEDYIELIDDLIALGQEVRQIDIAARFGVSQPTVAKMLARLADEGLIVRNTYRGVLLTEKGQEIAASSRERHQVVEAFLLFLGASPEIARIDAEGIEHHVSAETLDLFRRAMAKKH